jgi:dihydroneopterin aldolase
MFTINLHNLVFHSFHGIHEEERILGNTFIVNVSLDFMAVAPVTTLEQTVNYAAVYEIIRHSMQTATPLLETLVQDLTEKIYAHDKRIKSISVTVEKKNPPIPAFEGSVSVNFKKDF